MLHSLDFGLFTKFFEYLNLLFEAKHSLSAERNTPVHITKISNFYSNIKSEITF
jgi:hypothetical protein